MSAMPSCVTPTKARLVWLTDIAKQTRRLIESYTKKESCIILAVTPANTDLATSDSLQMAKQMDRDDNGEVSRSEWIQAFMASNGMSDSGQKTMQKQGQKSGNAKSADNG